MATVSFKGATRIYPGNPVPAVEKLDLDIADSEFMVLVGPSGSGKSTALRMLAGLEEVNEGSIYIGDRDVTHRPPKERDIAMVFQNYALYPHMTVADNMGFALKMQGVPKDDRAKRVREAAELLGLVEYLDRKPKALSGGQRQRVAMGRAIVREPQVFLMDEPLSNLDAKLRTQTRGEIRRLQQEVRTTTVYVTHDQVEAMTMGDRIAVMNDGVLEQVGTPEELYERPANRFVAGFIGSPAMSFFAASVNGGGLRAEGLDLALPSPSGVAGAVTVGVRPEHVRRWNGRGDLIGPISGSVAFVEALGRETFLGVDAGGSRVVVFEEGRSTAAPGDSIEFGLVPGGLRYFSSENGRALEPRAM